LVLDLTLLLTVLGIAVGVIGLAIAGYFYRKSKQDIQAATETILGRIVEVQTALPTTPATEPAWVGRKLTVETRLHVIVDAEVIAEGVGVRVQMSTGEIVAAKHQLQVEMRYALINMDSPLMVMESERLVGIMWARGTSPAGYSMGVVQLIESP
jgi:hypothetical protein